MLVGLNKNGLLAAVGGGHVPIPGHGCPVRQRFLPNRLPGCGHTCLQPTFYKVPLQVPLFAMLPDDKGNKVGARRDNGVNGMIQSDKGEVSKFLRIFVHGRMLTGRADDE